MGGKPRVFSGDSHNLRALAAFAQRDAGGLPSPDSSHRWAVFSRKQVSYEGGKSAAADLLRPQGSGEGLLRAARAGVGHGLVTGPRLQHASMPKASGIRQRLRSSRGPHHL